MQLSANAKLSTTSLFVVIFYLASLTVCFEWKPPDACNHPKDEGNGNLALGRWWFDGQHCEFFTYKGQGGNPNNFQTKRQCDNVCGCC